MTDRKKPGVAFWVCVVVAVDRLLNTKPTLKPTGKKKG
jgi:hypothetical protein